MALNDQQKEAAAHPRGHALVLAGPGAGKTHTLTARHAYLRSRGVDPDAILVITFTKEAASELRERLSKHVGAKAWIGTFHSQCLRLLKKFASEAGLRSNLKVLDPGAQRVMLQQMGVVWDADDGDLVDIIGRWKDSLTDPDQADADAERKNNVVLRMAAEHYRAYEDELQRRGDVDFADIVVLATGLIKDSPTVGEFVSKRLPHALVDEFQDVNRSQVEFLQALAAAGSTIWAVADDDQALYGWRGGNVVYTVRFPNYFPGARGYVLSKNYRCDPAIVRAANLLIANNRTRVAKKLVPTKEHRPTVGIRIRGFRTEKDEAAWAAGALARIRTAGARLSDVAILVRSAGVTPALQRALEEAGVPFSLGTAAGFWDLPETKAVSELLVAIEKGEVKGGQRFRGGVELVETMKGSAPPLAAPSVGRLVAGLPPAGANTERAASWADTCEAVAEIAREFATASEFLAHVKQMAAQAGGADGEDAVTISTIHSSKGLEWKHVVVAGCESGLLPHPRAEDKEEERRLFYVALTRSTGSVDLTWSKQRYGKSATPSPYLSEISADRDADVHWMGEERPEETRTAASTPEERAPRPDGKPRTYRRRGGGKSLIPPEEQE
jgi:DNA helicase-2/ATP-dependent DNA helicase PcrA